MISISESEWGQAATSLGISGTCLCGVAACVVVVTLVVSVVVVGGKVVTGRGSPANKS